MKASQYIHHPATLVHKLRNAADFCLTIFSLVSLVIMISLMGVGLWKMLLSILRFFGAYGGMTRLATNPPSSTLTPGLTGLENSGVASALEGLECIFLAPLAFLLVSGIWNFVEAVNKAIRDDKPLASVPPTFLNRVKGLIIGLMIAVVATDLLKRSIEEQGLTYRPAITGCLFIVVLAAYSFLIERSSSARSNAAEEADPGVK